MSSINISPEDRRFFDVICSVDAHRVSEAHMTPSDAWCRDFEMKQSAEVTGIDEAPLVSMFKRLNEAYDDVCRAQETEDGSRA